MFSFFFLSLCPLYVLLQEFVSGVHYFVVKEYISQLMKNNYSCKNRKNENAAAKIEVQWGELRELFEEMVQKPHFLFLRAYWFKKQSKHPVQKY